MSTKGSCAKADTNPLGKDPSNVHVDTMGLYLFGDQCTQLVPLECMTLRPPYTTFPYGNDVVRVSVVKVYHGDA